MCFLNAYANPANERLVAEHLRARARRAGVHLGRGLAADPRVPADDHHRVQRGDDAGHRARTSTSCRSGWPAEGFGGSVLMMLSNGGVVSADDAARVADPARRVRPGGRRAGRQRGSPGGSARTACCASTWAARRPSRASSSDGEPELTNTFEVARIYRFKKGSGFPVSVPSVDLVEIGAGGGSLARVDELGLLKVGPESAGADPGPACYGRGGTRAGGHRRRRRCSACSTPATSSAATCRSTRRRRRRRRQRSPTELGLPVDDTAGGHPRASSTRTWPRRRGCTPSSRASTCAASPLLAFGGAGPVHACGVAELLESPRVDLPGQRQRAVGASARSVTPVRIDLARSHGARARRASTHAERDAVLDELRDEGRRVLAAAGVPDDARALPLRRSTPATSARATRSRSGSARATHVAGDDGEVVRARSTSEYRAHLRPDDPRRRPSRPSRGGCRRTPPPSTVEPMPDRSATAPAPHTAAGRSRFDRGRPPRRDAGLPPRRRSAPAHAFDGPGDRRGARDDRRHPPGLDGRGRRRRLARSPTRAEVRRDVDVRPDRARGAVAEPDRHGQRAGQGAAAGRLQPDRARGRRPRQRRVRPARPDGRPGRHRHARATSTRSRSAPPAILDEYPPDSLEPGDVLITNDPYKTAGQLLDVTVLVPVFRDGRVIAFFGSTIHHTDVGGYGIGAGGRDVLRGRPVDPDLQADERRRAQRRRVEVHPLQRPPARSHGRRPARPDGVGRGRRAAAAGAVRRSTASTTSRTWPTRSSSAREAATRATHPRAAGGHVPRRAPCSTSPTAAAIDIVCAITVDPDAGEILVDYEGSSGASPYGINVVKNYTHAYTTFTVRSVLNPEIPNNHGSLAPIKVEAPEGSIVNAVSPAAVHRPPRRRHVPAQRAAQGAGPDQARAGDGRGLGRGVDDAGQRQPRRRPPVHHGDVHLRRRRRRAGRQARARRPARTRPASPPCRSRSSRRRRPIRFHRKAAARRAAVATARRPAGSARRSSSPSTRTRPWQLNAVTSPPRRARRRASSAASPARPGAFTRQRRSRSRPRPASRCSPATSCASSCRAAAATARRAESEIASDGARRDRADRRAARHRSTQSRRDVDDALTLPPERLHHRTSSWPSSDDALFDHEWLCVGAASRIPNPGDYFTTTVNGEPLIVARAKDGSDPRLLGGLPAPRHAGRRRRAATAPRSPARTTTGSTASTVACSARRRWSAPHDFDKKDWGLPDAAGRGVAGLRVRQLRPRRRAARADAGPLRAVPRALRPRRRRVPRHVHAHRPSVELEGDVRELQRRLPRQPAAPDRSRTSARASCAAFPVPWDDASQRRSSAPTATPTSTAASTPPPRRSCRCSPT